MGLRLEPKLQQGRDRLMRTNAQGCLFVGVQEPCITFRGPNTGRGAGLRATGTSPCVGCDPPAPVWVKDTPMTTLASTFRLASPPQAQHRLLDHGLGTTGGCIYLAFLHDAWII